MIYLYLVLLAVCMLISLFVGFVMANNVIGILRGRGVPYIPLERKVIESIIKNYPLDNKQNIRFVDLGSGDGRILFAFEKSGINDVTGYEVNWWAYLKSKFLAKRKGSQAKIYYKSFFNTDLSQYNVVFCYLLSTMLTRLRGKFDKDLKPGTLIISAAFEAKDWKQPIAVLPLIEGDASNRKLFIYKI